MLTTVGKVRDIMGLGQDVGIKDEVIIEMIKIAQEKIKRDLFKKHFDERPTGYWKDGTLWDGNNVNFTVSYPIADANFDGVVDSSDISGYWFDKDNNVSSCSITVINSRYGYITIAKEDGTAIDADAKDIKLEYYTIEPDITEQQLEDLCTYLTAHLIEIALREPDVITVADIEGNQQRLLQQIEKERSKYLYMYKSLLKSYSKIKFRGVNCV